MCKLFFKYTLKYNFLIIYSCPSNSGSFGGFCSSNCSCSGGLTCQNSICRLLYLKLVFSIHFIPIYLVCKLPSEFSLLWKVLFINLFMFRRFGLSKRKLQVIWNKLFWLKFYIIFFSAVPLIQGFLKGFVQQIAHVPEAWLV